MRHIIQILMLVALFALSCSVGETNPASQENEFTQQIVNSESYSYQFKIDQQFLEEIRTQLEESGARFRTAIEPPFPNDNHWPPTNVVPGFIVLPIDGVTGQHIYYIHESVVPDTGVEFSIIEYVYTLEDGSVVGGLEFSPHGTFFLDHTYLYWDYSYLFDQQPENLTFWYWVETPTGDWVEDINRELSGREKRRAKFEIEHFSIYAIRKSTMPKPPPPCDVSLIVY